MANLSKADWSNLYKAAIRLKDLAPWEWMENEDLFAVENPVTRETGYCSILGAGKEQFGLGIFLGDDGYRRYLRIISDEPVSDDFTESVMTPMLSVLFADRADLQPEDLSVIRALGLKFRGKNAWPLFRSQEIGYAPWFLAKEEAVFLTSAIEQALVVANRVRTNKVDLYEGADDDLILTRQAQSGEWEDAWRKAPAPPSQLFRNTPSAEVMAALENLRSGVPKRRIRGTWELDVFVVPVPIGSKSGRPRFPLCFLAVESKAGLVVAHHMSEPWIDLNQKQTILLRILDDAQVLPQSINVKSLQVQRVLEPAANALGIRVHLGAVPMLERFKSSLIEHLDQKALNT